MSELRELLERFAEDGEPRGATAVFTDAVHAAGRRRRRRRGQAVAAMALVLVLVTASIAVIASNAQHDGNRVRTIDSGPPGSVAGVSVDRLIAGHWESLPAAPIVGREQASVVWTGRELLVWGGISDTNPARFYSDGAAYDPSTGSWRRLPPAPLSARELQATVWTGTDMVIWGGYTNDARGSATNTGAAYDPTTNRWWRLRTGPLKPQPNAVAVWSGDRVIIFSYQSPDVAAYDPTTDQWSLLARPTPPPGHTLGWIDAVHTSGGELLAWSHWDIGTISSPTNGGTDLFALDEATNRWRTLPTSPGAIPDVQAAFSTGQRVIVSGDDRSCWLCLGPGPLPEVVASYDLATNTWTRLPQNALAKGLFAPSGFVFAWTGTALWSFYAGETQHVVGVDLKPGDTSIYDPTTRHWTRLDRAPFACVIPLQIRPIWTGTEILLYCPHGTSGGLAYIPAPARLSEPKQATTTTLVAPLPIAQAAGPVSATEGQPAFLSTTEGWICDTPLHFTTDSGVTWQSISVGTPDYTIHQPCAFVSGGHAWIAVHGAPGHPIPSIVRVVAGPRPQVDRVPLQGAAPNETVWSLAFADPLHGWVATITANNSSNLPSNLYRTTDGGAHWERISSTSEVVSGLRFTSPTAGWAVSGHGLVRTVDGGRTWHNVPIAPSPQVRGDGSDFLVSVFPFGEHIVVDGMSPGGNFETLFIEVSNDGGAHWSTQVVSQSIVEPAGTLSDEFVAVDAAHWRFGLGSELVTTDDAGTSWHVQSTHVPLSDLAGISFVTRDIGWATACNGRCGAALTTDAGRSWRLLTQP